MSKILGIRHITIEIHPGSLFMGINRNSSVQRYDVMNSCATALIVSFHFIERTTFVKFAVTLCRNLSLFNKLMYNYKSSPQIFEYTLTARCKSRIHAGAYLKSPSNLTLERASCYSLGHLCPGEYRFRLTFSPIDSHKIEY